MDTGVIELSAIVPAFLAIMSLVLYTPRTRWLSYAIILSAIGAELIPLWVNVTALLSCVSCLLGLTLREFIQAHNIEKLLVNKERS